MKKYSPFGKEKSKLGVKSALIPGYEIFAPY
jgi:hypothetical protein